MTALDPQTVLIIAGPTGSGKSALAIDIAETLNGVVINADSMQMYRDLRVLTARPSSADEARAPHRLYGVAAAAEPASAGGWLALAVTEIEAARRDRRLPIVAGGSGLYLRALTAGLSPLPAIPADVRRTARALFERLGAERFRAALAAVDPHSARTQTDPQRLVRAYEVAVASGRTLPDWHAAAPPKPAITARFRIVALLPPRTQLYPWLNARFERMLEAGGLDEVAHLLAMNLDPGLPVMKALGVAPLVSHLRGACSLRAAQTAAQAATRRFAKRQMTWLRHQMTADGAIDAQFSESLRLEIRTFIRQLLLTGD